MVDTSTPSLSFLQGCIPIDAFNIIRSWIQQHGAEIILKNPRSSKLGDYRAPSNNQGHRITINKNLNPYALVITITHEIAHLETWTKYKKTKKPHGPEWKKEFQNLMLEFAPLNLFPAEVEAALSHYLTNPKASSCSDYSLSKSLMKFDNPNKLLLTVENIPQNTWFKTSSGRVFKRGGKLRKRYKCLGLSNGRYYLFNPLAEVSPIKDL
jgi:hypothetical protein